MSNVTEFLSSLPRENILMGDKCYQQKLIPLKAGKISMFLDNGNLRYISAGGTEILRMIYCALRDKHWVTVIPELTYTLREIEADSFRINYTASYKTHDIDFRATFIIEGKNDSSLVFRMQGEALNSFEKNRIGFCILHPAATYCGTTCIVRHGDGSTGTLEFPQQISPEQPFTDIESMSWETDNIAVEMTMLGDVFETEDQRNWSDSTFKTYSTPLSKPFPVMLEAGAKTWQEVQLKARIPESASGESDSPVMLTINNDQKRAMSPTGLGMSSLKDIITPEEADIIRSLGISHLRIELPLFDAKWRERAIKGTTEAKILECPVEYVLIVDDDAINQIVSFINFSEDEHPETAIITLLHRTEKSTPDWLSDALIPMIRNAFPEIRVACGTNANFAQVNRSRPGSVHCEIISWAIHPQEHASDILTLTENLQPQADTIKSARTFPGDKGVWVSPITMQRRFNANVSNFEERSDTDTPPPSIDTRMMSLYGACWTAGSLKHILETGVDGVTYYETVGERGLIQGNADPRWPAFFRSCRKMIFPLFHVFRYILNYKGYSVVSVSSTSPLQAEALAIAGGDDLRLLIINYTPEKKNVVISGCRDISIRCSLNAETFSRAASDPDWIASEPETLLTGNSLSLDAFSVVFASARI